MSLGAWVLGALVLTATLAAKDRPVLPAPEKAAHLGCAVTERPATRFERGGWYLRVWADFDGRPAPTQSQHHWEALYSVRERRMEALQDCDRWMEEVLQAQAKARRAAREADKEKK